MLLGSDKNDRELWKSSIHIGGAEETTGIVITMCRNYLCILSYIQWGYCILKNSIFRQMYIVYLLPADKIAPDKPGPITNFTIDVLGPIVLQKYLTYKL